MDYYRDIKIKFDKWLPKKEAIIIYGARQIGKTTFLKNFVKEHKDQANYLNCEDPAVEEILTTKNLNRIRALFGNNKYICLDEAQSITDIGPILKLIYDELDYKLIATGSSSFELANSIIEPLTGRHITMSMYPLTIKELAKNKDWLYIENNLHEHLIFGMYPEIVQLEESYKKEKLRQIASDYMFKDILKHEDIRHSDLLRKILKSLAFRIGSEISSNNLANEYGVSRLTVERYLDLLEKCFIIFPLSSLCRNLDNELRKSKKYYFFDNGLRNALINNFTEIQNRTDNGQLWENFCISEIIKSKMIIGNMDNNYFWRTYNQAEIDLVMETNGKFDIWEFKWNPRRKPKIPQSFIDHYEIRSTTILTPKNLYELLED